MSAGSNMHRYKAQNHRVPNGRKRSGGGIQVRRRTWGVLWRISHVHEVSYILRREGERERESSVFAHEDTEEIRGRYGRRERCDYG